MRLKHLSSTVLFFASTAAFATAAEPDLRLVRAVEARNAQAVHKLLAQHVNVNIARTDGATPLLLASHWDDLDLVDRLLRAGASVNAAENHGVTPLALACENASPSVVARLLKAGANPNLVEPSGLAPLMRAARSGHRGIVDALIGKGANVNAAIGTTGQTALMWATAEQHADVMQALIAAGANVRVASTIGFTPLLFAVRNDDREGIKMLLDAGAGVNQPGSDGTQALALAVVSGHDDLALYLLDHGADPNSTMFGISALHAAIGDIDKWLRDWLRLRAVSVRERNTLGIPLARRLPLVNALLAHGANPNARIAATTNGSAYLYPSNDRHGAFDDIEQHGTGDLNGATRCGWRPTPQRPSGDFPIQTVWRW
jgi:ankyrin repeat protein